ncbi:MAG: hypothetical protein LBP26_02200 [Clostridiales bacterium]|jgi:hypothetical protein|nr:hypothetical protein [Clostridiales bacterium]
MTTDADNKDDKKPAAPKKPPASPTRRLAVAAVSAALAAVMIVLTNVLPLRVTLLMFAAVCYYIAFEKSGTVYGLLSIAASVLIAFFTGQISSAFILTCIIFAPYSFLAYLMRNLYYTRRAHLAVRAAVVAVFAALVFAALYLLVNAAAVTIAFDLASLASRLGAVPLAVLFIILSVVFDVVFTQVAIRLSKLIK